MKRCCDMDAQFAHSRAKVVFCPAANRRALLAVSFDSWPAHIDDQVREFLSSAANGEREAIATIRDLHPELPEDLIWARIVYLGLTGRIRRPYQKYAWTETEDQILRAEYGRSRASSRTAIDKILELHPEWSRDAVVWRARTLGLTQHRAMHREQWSPALDHCLLSLMGRQLDTVAERLNRSKKSVLGRLRRLGWGADFFGGFKTKDLALDLLVSEAEVKTWVRCGWLERKKGRITEESLRSLCQHHPEVIPFEKLTPVAQNWLVLSLGYGRGPSARHGGRRKRGAQSEIGGSSSQQSDSGFIL